MFKKVVFLSNRFFPVTIGLFSFREVFLRLKKFFFVSNGWTCVVGSCYTFNVFDWSKKFFFVAYVFFFYN